MRNQRVYAGWFRNCWFFHNFGHIGFPLTIFFTKLYCLDSQHEKMSTSQCILLLVFLFSFKMYSNLKFLFLQIILHVFGSRFVVDEAFSFMIGQFFIWMNHVPHTILWNQKFSSITDGPSGVKEQEWECNDIIQKFYYVEMFASSKLLQTESRQMEDQLNGIPMN